MAGFSYVRSLETADRLIRRFGGPATLHEDAPGDQPERPWDPSGGAAPRPRVLVGPTFACRTDYASRDVNGTTILASDSRIYLSAAPGLATPRTGMSLVLGDSSYEIVAVRTLAPAGTVVMHEVQGRA